MARNSKTKITLYIVVIVVVAICVVDFIKQQSSSDSFKGIAARSKGNPQAKVKVVEFIDFQCPACARGSDYLVKFMKSHPDQLYLQLKYYPLKMHAHAHQAAVYAECAARQDKFWLYHDFLILNQKEWRSLSDAKPMFEQMAQLAKLDQPRLSACLKDPSVNQVIQKDRQEGDSKGIKSTPTYFINGKMVVGLKSLKEKFAILFENENP